MRSCARVAKTLDALCCCATPKPGARLNVTLQVEVVAEVDGWLHCLAASGAKGLVPASYMQLLPAADGASPSYRASSPGPSVSPLLPACCTPETANIPLATSCGHYNIATSCGLATPMLSLQG